MIKPAVILALAVIISSIYAWIVQTYPVEIYYTVLGINLDLSSPNIYTYHCALAVVELLTIYFLNKHPVAYLTKALVLILSISFVNHTIGAYAFVAYNDPILVVYDFSRLIILAAEIMAFTLYGLYTVCGRPDNLDTRIDIPGFLVVENDKWN